MSVDCQPLARLEPAGYRPACLCGWAATFTRANRAEALAVAYARHDEKENAAMNGAELNARYALRAALTHAGDCRARDDVDGDAYWQSEADAARDDLAEARRDVAA